MRKLFVLVSCFFMVLNSWAQQIATIEHLKAVINGHNLVVTWNDNSTDSSVYWEVQGSVDGKTFQTVGLVLGAKPGGETEFAFKTECRKMKKGLQFFRVLQIQNDHTAVVYNAVVVK